MSEYTPPNPGDTIMSIEGVADTLFQRHDVGFMSDDEIVRAAGNAGRGTAFPMALGDLSSPQRHAVRRAAVSDPAITARMGRLRGKLMRALGSASAHGVGLARLRASAKLVARSAAAKKSAATAKAAVKMAAGAVDASVQRDRDADAAVEYVLAIRRVQAAAGELRVAAMAADASVSAVRKVRAMRLLAQADALEARGDAIGRERYAVRMPPAAAVDAREPMAVRPGIAPGTYRSMPWLSGYQPIAGQLEALGMLGYSLPSADDIERVYDDASKAVDRVQQYADETKEFAKQAGRFLGRSGGSEANAARRDVLRAIPVGRSAAPVVRGTQAIVRAAGGASSGQATTTAASQASASSLPWGWIAALGGAAVVGTVVLRRRKAA